VYQDLFSERKELALELALGSVKGGGGTKVLDFKYVLQQETEINKKN